MYAFRINFRHSHTRVTTTTLRSAGFGQTLCNHSNEWKATECNVMIQNIHWYIIFHDYEYIKNRAFEAKIYCVSMVCNTKTLYLSNAHRHWYGHADTVTVWGELWTDHLSICRCCDLLASCTKDACVICEYTAHTIHTCIVFRNKHLLPFRMLWFFGCVIALMVGAAAACRCSCYPEWIFM